MKAISRGADASPGPGAPRGPFPGGQPIAGGLSGPGGPGPHGAGPAGLAPGTRRRRPAPTCPAPTCPALARLALAGLLLCAGRAAAQASGGLFEFGGELEASYRAVIWDKSHPAYRRDQSSAASRFDGDFRPVLLIQPGGGLSARLGAQASAGLPDWSAWSLRLLEASLSLQLAEGLRLDLGKERLDWGRSRLYRYSDCLQEPGDALDPRAGRPGALLGRLALEAGQLDLQLIATPADEPEESGAGARLGLNRLLPETDLDLMVYWSHHRSWCLGASLETTPLARTGFLEGLALYGETGLGLTSGMQRVSLAGGVPVLAGLPDRKADLSEGFQVRAAAGLRLPIPLLRTVAQAEYCYRSDGLDSGQLADLVRYGLAAAFPAAPSGIAQHSLLLSLFQPAFSENGSPFTDSLSATVASVISLSDASALLQFRLESGIIRHLAVWLEGSVYLGERDRLWRSSPAGWTLAAGARLGF